MTEPTHSECARACAACAAACDACLSACLLERDVTPMARCIALDLECAAVCRLLAGFADRGSRYAPALAQVAATLCNACANECGKHSHAHCARCAEACLACAQVCTHLAMLGEGAPAPHRHTQEA